LRICIVTNEIKGPQSNGGIAVANLGLARFLAKSHAVTVLYTGPNKTSLTWDAIIQKFALEGIDFLIGASVLQDCTMEGWFRKESYKVYRFLRDHPFDVVFFNEYHALGYYSLLARKNGTEFANTRFVTVAHGCGEWCREVGKNFFNPKSFDEIFDLDFMERRTFEMADYAISPSRYLIDWMERRNWRVDRARHLFNILDLDWLPERKGQQSFDELVFFGRHETRKGFLSFLDAVRGSQQLDRIARITFLGKPVWVHGNHSMLIAKEMLAPVLEKHPKLQLRFLPFYDSEEASTYLATRRCLVVIGSHAENSPCVVVESLAARTSFLSSSEGGGKEMIDAADWKTSTFDPGSIDLTMKIDNALTKGLDIPRSAYDDRKVRAEWASLIEEIEVDLSAQQDSSPVDTTKYKVSVVITHYNRSEQLTTALASVRRQTHRNIEVVISDDGSTQEHLEAVQRWEKAFDLPLKVVTGRNAYLGAARNRGIAAATGDYVLFLDDDDALEPDAIQKLLACALTGDFAAVSGGSRYFVSIPNSENVPRLMMFLEPSAPASAYTNVFGSCTTLFKREVVEKFGYTELYGVGFEDYELLQRIHGAGLPITTIPEIILNYRVQPDSMLRRRGYDGLAKEHWRVHRNFNDRSFDFHGVRLLTEFARASFLAKHVGERFLDEEQHRELNGRLGNSPDSRQAIAILRENIGTSNFVIAPDIVVDARKVAKPESKPNVVAPIDESKQSPIGRAARTMLAARRAK